MRVKAEVRGRHPLSDHISWFGDSKNVVLMCIVQILAIDGQKDCLDWLWILGRASLVS